MTTSNKVLGHDPTLIRFELYVKNGRKASLVKLYASVNALDIDDPRPAITVMLPEEI
jgi:hypothetical protein